MLKSAKRGALISDLEREWDAGQRVASLAGHDGNLPGFMKVGVLAFDWGSGRQDSEGLRFMHSKLSFDV